MGATISYNGATIETIEDGHSWTIPKTAKPQTNVEIQFDGDGSINYRGEITNIAKGKMARLLCKDKLLASDVVVSVEDNGLNHKGIIPEGATYRIKATNTLLEAGDAFPATVEKGDIYTFGDYDYCYNYLKGNSGWYQDPTHSPTGWGVGINTAVTDKNQASYGAILESINGKDVTGLCWVFNNCAALITAPAIPSKVTDMLGAFSNCSALTTAPVIPEGVTIMIQTFMECPSLKTYEGSTATDGDFSGYVIPSSVTDMRNTFNDCASLTVAPDMSKAANVITMNNTFGGCTSLTTPPIIPDSVENMTLTFMNCSALITAPVIPEGVTAMDNTFMGCTSLKTYEGSTATDGDFSGYVIPAYVTTMRATFSNCGLLTLAPDMSHVTSLSVMDSTFSSCTALTKVPVIPASVTTMSSTFYGCTSLKTYEGSTAANGDFSGYVIPAYVTNMYCTFYNCRALTAAPVIPSRVKDMQYTFCYCMNLSGSITINATPTSYSYCLRGTKITEILGSCGNKEAILATK